MNYLRSMVSGTRKRYKKNGYDLDLTYITERLIAMSFPASGIESTYRNHISSVSKLCGSFFRSLSLLKNIIINILKFII